MVYSKQRNSQTTSRKSFSNCTNIEVGYTLGFWSHKCRQIQFTLVVNNFRIKCSDKEHADHLIIVLRSKYTAVVTNWKGKLYCGITLN